MKNSKTTKKCPKLPKQKKTKLEVLVRQYYYYYCIPFPNVHDFPNGKALRLPGYRVRPQLRMWQEILILTWIATWKDVLGLDLWLHCEYRICDYIPV